VAKTREDRLAEVGDHHQRIEWRRRTASRRLDSADDVGRQRPPRHASGTQSPERMIVFHLLFRDFGRNS